MEIFRSLVQKIKNKDIKVYLLFHRIYVYQSVLEEL